ncbi:DNA-binding MarR family transcriptional regulator [Dysgonomonas sp. PH5-45]|uniref:MarR family winged helix-turn-helix transcriptional regulator n=1 Tax=unclassified Dysgonomonas TaxID=2630389 RepID=UPI002476AFF6|nr:MULTISPECIES: MarR family transcriptional regulator [unclassified Dysgonomonas]MDH6354967.1 DNA-binding MarR family transcriptional regulator [Dysgonomonas sp. PH5-45]MDH6387909.1 DNA-binding MarR family transcriptional regulator [Dysgonomonas sp. PH5-37]
MEEYIDNDLEYIFPIINGKVSTAINRKMFRNFRKEGLDITPEQWSVLYFLWKEDGVLQQKLCEATFKDKPSMTRLIDNLVKQGFVFRLTPPNDRRSNLIYLTDKGRGIQPAARRAMQATMHDALIGINAEGLERVKTVLKLIFDNVQEALGDNPRKP